MSFSLGKAIDPLAKRQITARQDILQEEKRNIKDFKFFQEKMPWIRLTSGVDVKTGETENGEPILDSSLAELNVLSNGVSLVGESPVDNYEETILGYRPLPGITSMNLRTHNRFGSLRTATVNFTVHSVDQLNTYEQLFMRPGYSALLEWGHSKYLEVDEQTLQAINFETGQVESETLVNYGVKSISSLVDFFKDEGGPDTKQKLYEELVKKREDYHYNYDGMYGLIKNFSWSINPNGSYNCSVDIVSIGSILESLDINVALTPAEIKAYLEYENETNREERIRTVESRQVERDVPKGGERDTELSGGAVVEDGADELLLKILKQHFDGLSNTAQGIGKVGYMVDSGSLFTTKAYDERSEKLGYRVTKVEAAANKQLIEIYTPTIFYQYIANAYYTEDTVVLSGPNKGKRWGDVPALKSELERLKKLRPRFQFQNDKSDTFYYVNDDIVFGDSGLYRWDYANDQDRKRAIAKIVTKWNVAGPPIRSQDLEVDEVVDGNRYRFTLVQDPIVDDNGRIRYEQLFFGGLETLGTGTRWFPVAFPYTYTITLPEGQSSIQAPAADDAATNTGTASEFDDIFELVSANVEPLASRIHYILSQYKDYLITTGESDKNFDDSNLPFYNLKSRWNSIVTRWNTRPSQDGTGSALPFTYVQLGLFLDMINRLLPRNGSKGEHFTKFYTGKSIKHRMKTLERFHFSVEPEKCLLPLYSTGKINILSIYLNIDFIFRTVEKYYSSGALNVYNLISDILAEIEISLGSINSFELQYFERDNTYHIVDREIIDPDNMEDNLVNLNLFGKHTTVRNLNIVSKLSPSIGAQLAIASQADPYSNSLEASAWQHFNENLVDRFTAIKKDEGTIAQEAAVAEIKYEELLDNYTDVFEYLNSVYPKPGSDREAYEKALQSERGSILPQYKIFCQQALRKQFLESERNEKPQGPGFIIPYELSVTIEGFSGFNVMESFKIQDNIIPDTYKGNANSAINFIITGLEHRVDTQAWTTTVKAQIYNVPKGGVPIRRDTITLPDDRPDYRPGGGSQPPAELLALSSTKSIDALHPDFKPIVQRIMKTLEDKGYQPVLGSAWRSIQDQIQKYEEGKSEVKIGNHSTVIKDSDGNFVRASTAVDIIDKRYAWNPDPDTTGDKPEHYSLAADFFKALGEVVATDPDAKDMFRWGGSWSQRGIWKHWNMGWDPAHVEWWDAKGKQLYAQTKKYVENNNTA